MKKIKLKESVSLARRYIFQDLWKIELSKFPWIKRNAYKLLRTFVLAYRGFKEDKVNLRASALTFFSMLSVVPVLAMAFGIAKGFGFENKLRMMLEESLKGQQEVANWLISFATNMLSNVKVGVIAGIGLAFLIWSVMKVLGNIENAFNDIWQVKKSRVLFRKFSDYLAMMMIAPVMIILSSGTQVFIVQFINRMSDHHLMMDMLGPFISFAVQFVPYIIVWLLFTFVYMVMPNTNVKFGSALLAGIIAGTTFQLLQWAYIDFQIGVSQYNGIYGSFAALPLFLVWLNWSWLIVLFGAEISFAAQNHQKYEYESDIKGMNLFSKQLMSYYLVHFIVKHFEKGEPPLTSQSISEQLKLPVRLVRQLLYELVECRIIAETVSDSPREPAFLPARDIQGLTLAFIRERMELQGTTFDAVFKTDSLKKIDELLTEFKKTIEESPANLKLKDI